MWWHERNLGFRSLALYTSMQTQQAVRSSLSSSAAVVTLFAAMFQLDCNLCNCTNNIDGLWDGINMNPMKLNANLIVAVPLLGSV